VITHLHIEASSFCNARCPGCPRNAYGYPLEGFYKEKNLNIDSWKKILSDFPHVKNILFCGNHGDPMMNPDIAEIVELANVNCSIATNGSIGRTETYKKLARLNTKITFGIDGLEDTNHLYRQGVKWNFLMDRIKNFITNGGEAEWQFIVFKHNQHQIKTARQLSIALGFKGFKTVYGGRDNFPAIQLDKTISHWILPANSTATPDKNFDVDEYINMRYHPYNLKKSSLGAVDVDCEHLRGSVYVNAEGEYFPCCYQGFGHVDRPKVPLKEFYKLKDSWDIDCNKVCASSCKKP
jgi:MoaA/NifB/PqqE/SkfB family radical SAM enzyme